MLGSIREEQGATDNCREEKKEQMEKRLQNKTKKGSIEMKGMRKKTKVTEIINED